MVLVKQVKFHLIFVTTILLIVCCCVVESKRGFSIGRSRKKVANPNVRRKNQGPDTPIQPSAPDHSPSNQKPIGWNVDNKPVHQPVGPPPAYPGMGHNSVPSHGAPPAYSPSHVNPPSYSSATGNAYSNIGRIPPRGSPPQGGFPDSTSFHGIGYGHNAYGGPSHTSGLYTNNGMGMGGFSGLGTYGSGYGYNDHRSSPFSFGNILTGLALWNIASGFNSYNRPQHVYIHHNREGNDNKGLEASKKNESNSTQMSDQILEPVVPSTTSEVVSECATCTEITIVSTEQQPTEVPMNFVTYHPSLLIYAREMGYQPDSLHYYNEKTGGIVTEINNVPESTTLSTTESIEETSTEN